MKTPMQKIVAGIFLALALQNPETAAAQNSTDESLHCLQIEGKILSDSKEGDCLIELYTNCTVVDSVRLPENENKFRFVLQRNKTYTIKISQVNHVTKLVCINTELPLEFDKIFRFRFTTKLISEKMAKRMNADALEFPVAIVYFEKKYRCFEFHKEYTSNIKREWYQVRTDEMLSLNN